MGKYNSFKKLTEKKTSKEARIRDTFDLLEVSVDKEEVNPVCDHSLS